MLRYENFATNQIEHQVTAAPKIIQTFQDDNTKRLDDSIATLQKDYDSRQKMQTSLDADIAAKTAAINQLTKSSATAQSELTGQVQVMKDIQGRIQELSNLTLKGREQLLIHNREVLIYKRQIEQITLEKNAALYVVNLTQEKLANKTGNQPLSPLETRRANYELTVAQDRIKETDVRLTEANNKLQAEKQKQELLAQSTADYSKIMVSYSQSRLEAEDAGIALRKSMEADRVKLGQLRDALTEARKQSAQNTGAMAQIQEKLNAVKQQRASYKPFTPSGKY
jgi:chromosome segregation ATPase